MHFGLLRDSFPSRKARRTAPRRSPLRRFSAERRDKRGNGRCMQEETAMRGHFRRSCQPMSHAVASARLWIAHGMLTGCAQQPGRPLGLRSAQKNPESPACALRAVQDGEVLQRGKVGRSHRSFSTRISTLVLKSEFGMLLSALDTRRISSGLPSGKRFAQGESNTSVIALWFVGKADAAIARESDSVLNFKSVVSFCGAPCSEATAPARALLRTSSSRRLEFQRRSRQRKHAAYGQVERTTEETLVAVPPCAGPFSSRHRSRQ